MTPRDIRNIQTTGNRCRDALSCAKIKPLNRLQHIKNKGVQQPHASSQNSDPTDVRKVARHPPSRPVIVCNDYSFQNTIVFVLIQRKAQTIIKLKLKQASKEFQKELYCEKKYGQDQPKCFLCLYRDFKVRSDLKCLERFSRIKQSLVVKLVLNKINLTFTVQNLICFLLRFSINRVGCLFLSNTDILPCSVVPST